MSDSLPNNFNLAIASRDAPIYAKLLGQAGLPGLRIKLISQSQPDAIALQECELLLADPDLALGCLPAMPRLQWLQSTWAGNAPLLSHSKRDYQLTGIKGIFGVQMTEYALAYMLYFARDIPGYQARQQQKHWAGPTHSTLRGRHLGILGVGSIGREVASVCRALGMEIHGVSLRSRDCEAVGRYYDLSQLQEFAGSLDYLLCLLPHTEQTANLVDQTFLNWLPSHCVLINAGRGSLIDDEALCEALRAGHLKAAVLDVFREEPLPDTHPFWHTPNLLITQHTAALSRPELIVPVFIDNYRLWLSGEPMDHKLDFARGY